MIKTSFNTVATILALHIPPEISTQFKNLHDLSVHNDGQYQALVDLTESNCLALMHDAYENMTPSGTPLQFLPVFLSCFRQFIAHQDAGHLSNFISSVHNNPVRVKQELAKHGITVTHTDDGITIETGGKPIMPATDVFH